MVSFYVEQLHSSGNLYSCHTYTHFDIMLPAWGRGLMIQNRVFSKISVYLTVLGACVLPVPQNISAVKLSIMTEEYLFLTGFAKNFIMVVLENIFSCSLETNPL